MKKKFTLLITVTSLLLGTGNIEVWGQAIPNEYTSGPHNTHDCSTSTIPDQSWTLPDNNFGPGETGTIRPLSSGTSHNSGTWTNVTTNTRNPFNTGDGVITIGNTSNVVLNYANVANVSDNCSYSYTDASWVSHTVNHSASLTAPTGAITVPDGTGKRRIGGTVAASDYTHVTHITVDAVSKNSGTPWHLEMFNFLDNQWYYYNYNLTLSTANICGSSNTHYYSCTTTGGSPATCTTTHSCYHKGVGYTSSTNPGFYVDGEITLTAGSHVRLDGAGRSYSIGAGTHTNSKATVNLPGTHYSLMLDKNLDAASITSNGVFTNLQTLGIEAVLGIQGNFLKGSTAGAADMIQTNAAGSTILIGASTTGQADMFVKVTSGTIADQVGKTFDSFGQVYTGSYYNKKASNFGNYGANHVTVTDAATMFADNVGTRGWQVYAHNGTGGSCLNFTYNTSPLVIAVNTFGSYLQSVENSLTYNVSSTFNASNNSGTTGGHTTLRAGNEVLFNSTHTYAGTGIGDYLVNAVGNITSGGYKFCGTGNIVVATGIAPVYAHNNANVSGGHLEWNAANNIQTGSQVKFENDYSTNIDWIAGNDILTNDTITFTNGSSSATGHTKWTAGHDIVTNSDVAALTPDNGVIFTHNGSGLTQWQAGNDIHTWNIINFERTSTSTGKTRWWAGNNILTEENVTFMSLGQYNDSIYWRANSGNIETGINGGRIDFQNLHDDAAKSHTTWHAYNNIKTHAHVNFYNNTASSNTLWLTDQQNIETYDSVTFVNEMQGNTDWRAAFSILTNDTVEFTNHGSGYTKWDAIGGDISTNRPSYAVYPWTAENGFVTFNNDSVAVTEWEAGRDILTNNVVTFNNTIVNTTLPNTFNGYIKWWAQGGNIELNDSTIFNQLPTVAAPYGTLRGVNHIAGIGQTSQNLIPATSLWLIANDSILSERKNTPLNSPSGRNEEPLLINFNANNDAPIMLQAVNGDITLDGVLHIDRQNTGQSETTLEAGRDIHLLDTVTFYDPSDADILLHAHRDILTNMEDCSSDKTAPVTFEVTNTALTRWIADRNIHTRDTVNFKYNATTSRVRDLHLVAQGGNIKTERWFNIDYDSNNKILFSAVDDVHPYSYADQAFGGPTVGRVNNPGSNPRNTDNGNIWFNDSIKITRTNAGAGITNILAKYNIRTAMFDYMDSLSNANNTTIESYKGDIFLGYSTEPDMCANPSPSTSVNSSNYFDYDTTRFKYTVLNPQHDGLLDIKAGFEDAVDDNHMYDGGNIYFSHIDKYAVKSATSATKITIPFSNEYYCGKIWSPDNLYMLGNGGIGAASFTQSRIHYEHAGIIGGVGPCGQDLYYGNYDPMQGSVTPPIINAARDTSLIYKGNQGNLLVDAGLRGNIIMNRGTYLNFQDDNGNTEFRTRWGNIDMRYPFNGDSIRGSLLFLASSDLPNKLQVNACGCDEERNNIYLQDFKYNPVVNSGSIFVGADNNIKLQYGGLKTIGTQRDPFFSPNNNDGYPCSQQYHCDSDTSENLARDLILNFAADAKNAPIASGGFAAVASDLIDVYKTMIYTGGQGSGMSSVPGYGNLHGESVQGYGLYIKTQANKTNWGKNALDAAMTACIPEKCDDTCNVAKSVLQNVARVTFHSDARIYTENQRTYIGSPVLETYGNLDLNTHDKKGGKTGISIQTDSLIVHDSLILDGKLTKFTTWSGLYRDMPIIKLGHHRFTPPFTEDGIVCAPCFRHEKGTGKKANRTALDTLYVTFRHGAAVPRLHTLVADHTVLSFLTDSFDHVKGDPTINAKFYTDTFKIRNHVELYTDPKHEHDGHFELISEAQMDSKDYAGIYSRHLHMEPIAPACGNDFPYSQLWMQDPALDVITTSTFGGYGWIHADVHVEIEATLAPGFASLRDKGNYCYELKAGTLRMQDLRLDKGAELRYTIGDKEGFDGEKVDVIEVDEITMYGTVNVNVEKRCGQRFEEGCYPIIRYNSVAVDTVNLNNLKLATKKIDGYRLSLDTSIPGTVYLCVGEVTLPQIMREISIPQTEGVTTTPDYGRYYVASMDNFKFTAKYTTPEPLKVVTNRLAENGSEEELKGTLNANGEYEYVIRRIQQNIVLKFGPEFATGNELIDGRVVWSYNNTIYFRVDKEDIASIYSIAGQLVRRIELPEGDYSVPMDRGVYIVTLKDGSVHKVILK